MKQMAEKYITSSIMICTPVNIFRVTNLRMMGWVECRMHMDKMRHKYNKTHLRRHQLRSFPAYKVRMKKHQNSPI
jgi:hypothetical protein